MASMWAEWSLLGKWMVINDCWNENLNVILKKAHKYAWRMSRAAVRRSDLTHFLSVRESNSYVSEAAVQTESIMVMKQIILVLVVCISSSFSSITLSCFSYPLFDLPSLGFSSESGDHHHQPRHFIILSKTLTKILISGLFANSAANVLTNVGANNKTLTADFCFFAIAR